jgi:hypothetical protein
MLAFITLIMAAETTTTKTPRKTAVDRRAATGD